MAVKIISERNLDNKTIRKNDQGSTIEVAVAESEDNAIEVTDQGLKVKKPSTVKLVSLGEVELGEVIVNAEG